MYGYLSARLEALSEEELGRYKACYCGLCRSLRQRHGQFSALTLNFDMTFLILLLSSLYEPEESGGHNRCLPHPNSGREWMHDLFTDYAADMNVALAYLKCLDDWDDELKPASRFESAALRSSFEKVQKLYPRQCAAMEDSIRDLRRIENSGVPDADAASNTFGALMAEVLVYSEDRWSDTLRRMGFSLGKTIYLMDACMDLEKDARRGGYNPFINYLGGDNESLFRDILHMLMGECVQAFDALPLVRDVGILKNILCDGLWQQFDSKFAKEKGPLHE